jgi:iron complex outermembrane receptor protein
MASSYDNAPNSLTRLDADELRLLGIDNVVDALRLVPGMFVADIHGSNAAIGYHGSNVNVPRRMEILYNGASVYRPGYANIHWHRLPVDINDLAAIEVVRGSNVVDFGSNAYSATVNLIQKPKALEPSWSGSYSTDGSGVHNAWLSTHVQTERGHFNLRYFHEENTGFDRTANGNTLHDSSRGDNAIVGGEVEIDRSLVLDFQFGTNRYYFEPGAFPESADTDAYLLLATELVTPGDTPSEKSTFFNLKASRQTALFGNPVAVKGGISQVRFERRQTIDLCLPSFMFDPLIEQLDSSPNVRLHPSDIPLMIGSGLQTGTAVIDRSIAGPLSFTDFQLLNAIGQKVRSVGPLALQREVCGRTDQNVLEERRAAELQVVSNGQGMLQFSSTLGYSHTWADSDTYLGGQEVLEAMHFSNNLRVHLKDGLVLNAGAMLERNSQYQDNYVSYRLSLNYSPFPNHVVRATASQSQRSPDLYEVNRQWNYRVNYEPGTLDHNGQRQANLFRNAVSPQHLDPETVDTVEVGYTAFSSTSVFDIKIFREKHRDLISEQFQYLDFHLTNQGALQVQGAELGLSHQFTTIPGLKIGAGYAYVDNDTDTVFEDSLHAKHSGHVWAVYPLYENGFIGATHYYAEGIGELNYQRTDIALTNFVDFGETEVMVQLLYRRYPEVMGSYTEVSPTLPVRALYDDRNQWMLGVEFSY